jgi:hypothetical protein
MGLAEKRKLKELQDTTFPERQKELAEICGSEVKYDVDWASLADDAEGMNFIDNLSCHRINMAFRTICIDQLAKDCIKESLKTIKLKNVKEKKDMKIALQNGVLEMHLAYALRTDGMYSDTEIRDVVMKGL